MAFATTGDAMPTCPPRKSCPHAQSRALIKPWKWYHNEEESAKINIYKWLTSTNHKTGIRLRPSLLDYRESTKPTETAQYP